jgi:hypothetical protein
LKEEYNKKLMIGLMSAISLLPGVLLPKEQVRETFNGKTPTVLFEKNCHVTVNLEAIACARRCRSYRLTGWWTRKE